jgi:2-oxo-4-hydroxy-4-carboxy-5-ureidoimidazoline decarboxylase
MMTLDQINDFDLAPFVAALGGVFEHSPWVAERAWPQRPFNSIAALHVAMCAAVDASSMQHQLALIRAHPQLAGKAAIRGELTEASTREQRGAGLDQCSPDEFRRLTELNAAYEQKFGFPFIIAVRGHTRDSILAAMAQRLSNDPQSEHDEALRQIAAIAGFRLRDMIQS